MKKNLICIGCPQGCSLSVEINNNEVTVTGNKCKKGGEYAKNECICPKRTVTSTVRCADGRMLSVKTDREIPKDKQIECMQIINNLHPLLPIFSGDVIMSNVFGSNIVATSDMEAVI